MKKRFKIETVDTFVIKDTKEDKIIYPREIDNKQTAEEVCELFNTRLEVKNNE